MDLPINKIHRILLDASLPTTIEDLKNPTEEYVMKLLTSFLSRFSINMNLIIQPSAEQYSIMTYFKDSDIINLINLHAALVQIFDKIFLTDFCITDLTNPGPKRVRRQAKFVGNFVLYTMQKRENLNEKMAEISARCKLLEELKEKKAQIVESINNKALHKAKQLTLSKKLENDIQHMQLKIENNNKKELELEEMKNEAEKQNQIAKEHCRSVKAVVMKMSKAIDDLKSEVVHSPEEFKSRLTELEEQKNLKMEERDIMQESIQDKKQYIKQIGTELDIVQKVKDELSTLKIIYEQLINQRTQSDNIKKQIESLNNMWTEQQNKLAMHKDQVDTEINELQSRREEDIAPLRNLCKQLLSEKKLKQAELDASKVCFNEKCLQRDKLQKDIRRKQEETMALVHKFQETYDNEIVNELELWRAYKEL